MKRASTETNWSSIKVGKLLTHTHNVVTDTQLRYWTVYGYLKANPKAEGKAKRFYHKTVVHKAYIMGILVNKLGFQAGAASKLAEQMLATRHISNGKMWVQYNDCQIGIVPFKEILNDNSWN